MGHRILYVEKSNEFHLYLDNLKIENEKGELLFPISDILILVVDNYKSKLTVQLINKLTEYNVCTILCGVDHLPKSYIMPMNGHYSQSGNIQLQLAWTDEMKSKIHKRIIQAKIFNQIDNLKKNHCSETVIQKLTQFMMEVDDGDTGNREGLSAKMYFRELFGDGFVRFDEDVINAGLNYGYSIFRSLITSIVVSKGYLPNIGFFHKGKTNMFNLSDDLIEVFRPMVDDYVYNNMKDEVIFKEKHRDDLIKLVLFKTKIDDKFQTVYNAINLYIESILTCIEYNDLSYFVFPSIRIIENDL
ncbi:MAG: type II CRISPR-associated endonuclease Cas1 [Erysipelotrichia bacterium]|nr:type II CRISPR-associated endonuclease Cas1 [Erysipelotrichia bacterium]NCC54740.1 type II CRISPR-associated endonuclease Cas1 [Erysipelotrichia bacterium]